MAFSKLTRITLFVVAGISLVVVLFFYIGPKTLNYDALELKVEETLTPMDLTPMAAIPEIDTSLTDSVAIAENLAAVERAEEEAEIAAAEALNTPPPDLGEVLSGWEYLVWFRTDIALVWAYILIILTALAAIVFPLVAVISNPKALIRLLAILAGAAVLIVISYVLAKGTPIEIIGYTGTDNSDPGTLKMIDTVLFVTYMLFGLALGSILYAIISRAFK
ncbi:MAG: hypothetical protein P1P86_07190 [Bacteroidales bacterium]|nr:hypothetical protein [Bacteroidales bacterium]